MGCTTVQERYRMKPMAANTTLSFSSQSIGGFATKTDGTITITAYDGTVLVDEFPVTAGVYHPFPGYVHENGGTITLGGGASGTSFI